MVPLQSPWYGQGWGTHPGGSWECQLAMGDREPGAGRWGRGEGIMVTEAGVT